MNSCNQKQLLLLFTIITAVATKKKSGISILWCRALPQFVAQIK